MTAVTATPVGTTGLTDVIDALLTVYSIVEQAKAAGAVSINDLALLLQLIPVLGPAVQNAGDIPAEIQGLTSDEVAALAAHIVTKLAISDAHAAAVVTASLSFAASGFNLYKAIQTPPAVVAPAS